MQDARYLRAQAALCLEIADQMSDPKSREKMRADAAEYQARAAALEEGEAITRRVEVVQQPAARQCRGLRMMGSKLYAELGEIKRLHQIIDAWFAGHDQARCSKIQNVR